MDWSDLLKLALSIFLILTGIGLAYLFLRVAGVFQRLGTSVNRLTDKGKPIVVMVPNAAEQRTIELVKQLRDEGVTFRGIVAELKRRRRVNRAGNPFQLAQVQRILSRQ